MAINKVVYSGETLIDLTNLTVTPEKILKNEKAINKEGVAITGTLEVKKYYTGSTTPSSSLGNDGDLYLMV